MILLEGMLLGFSIAAPIGPIGALCIRRTIAEGMFCGLASGLGTATADAIYGGIAAFGITSVSLLLANLQVYLHALGGIVLLYMGYQAYRSAPVEITAKMKGSGLFDAYISAFMLTLMNPMTIMSFTAIFVGLGIDSANGSNAIFMVFGVFLGSMCWWLLLSGVMSKLRETISSRNLKWVNQISGIIIIAFGVMSLITV